MRPHNPAGVRTSAIEPATGHHVVTSARAHGKGQGLGDKAAAFATSSTCVRMSHEWLSYDSCML